ncbi:acyl-CoA dehydrogenase family protein [uncultured Albimonas sp.]|uniref:acyl-CoA dehydrogenase family protein n=1 Tax=uncultured Albimonas sp. TaxID=1331701 RepID=UPI0030EC3B33|tara:strand:+ start:3880 stop:5034 length:1155 start_codon:yes stop_codon:yes gene_type:complete
MFDYRFSWMDDELDMLSDAMRGFVEKEMSPHEARWQAQGHVDRDFWRKAGEVGMLCASIPEEYGGHGGDFRHEAMITYQQYAGRGHSSFGNGVHSQICAWYILEFGTEDQKKRWLPKMATGELVCAIAMTEPGAGSDLQSIRTRARMDGNEYVIDGSKVYISNGQQADLVITAVKTDPEAGAKGVSLIVVETAQAQGFRRGRNLEKLGLHGQDTSELFFDGVRVPPENLLGGVEGQGFRQLMTNLAQERLVICVTACGMLRRALETTIAFATDRRIFGGRLLDKQNTRFRLAEVETVTRVIHGYVDDCVARHRRGEFDAVSAAMAKWWVAEQTFEAVNKCLQLHGGAGYMAEYDISSMFTEARLYTIAGGSTETMKDLIARRYG